MEERYLPISLEKYSEGSFSWRNFGSFAETSLSVISYATEFNESSLFPQAKFLGTSVT